MQRAVLHVAVDEIETDGRVGRDGVVQGVEEVGAMVVQEEDEVLVVMQGGKVVRSAVSGVPAKGRDTMGVIFAKPDKNDRIIAVARNSERDLPVDAADGDGASDGESVEAPVDEVPLSTEEMAGPDAQSADDGGSE